MWRRIRVALWMLGIIAVLGGGGWLTGKYEGCGESRATPPKPACGFDKAPSSPRGVVAALVRQDPKWMLARDDDDGALIISASTSLFVFPESEHRDPEAALAAFVYELPPDVRTALRRTQLMLLWLGRYDSKTGGVRYPAWDDALGLQLFHDVLTPKHCFGRVAPADDPELHINRRHSNEHAGYMATLDGAIVRALRTSDTTPLSADESAARMRTAAPQLHDIATVTLRETYAPVSALVIVGIILLFYWWAVSAGKEDSIFELEETELRGDGALIAPGRFDARVLSHGLLHRDLKHLVNNAFALWIGCAILEPAIGSARTLIVFLAGVVGGALVRLRLKRPTLTIGASGGAFALQTAALVLLLHPGTWFLANDRAGYLIFLGIQLGFNLVASFLPGVSMAGHVGGALAGFAVTVTGLVMIGRPPLDGGPESALSAGLAWAIAGFLVLLWIGSGVLVQWGRTDLKSADAARS